MVYIKFNGGYLYALIAKEKAGNWNRGDKTDQD